MNATSAASGSAKTTSVQQPKRLSVATAPVTLTLDIGGTGLKASVLNAAGGLLHDRVRVETTYPCPPTALVHALTKLASSFASFDRVSVGFPGVVRHGTVLTAPHLETK